MIPSSRFCSFSSDVTPLLDDDLEHATRHCTVIGEHLTGNMLSSDFAKNCDAQKGLIEPGWMNTFVGYSQPFDMALLGSGGDSESSSKLLDSYQDSILDAFYKAANPRAHKNWRHHESNLTGKVDTSFSGTWNSECPPKIGTAGQALAQYQPPSRSCLLTMSP